MKQQGNKSKGWLVVCLGVLLAVKLTIGVVRLWKAGSHVREAEAALIEAEAKNVQLKQRLAEVSSQEFVEREAREKLGLGREGETVLIVPETGTTQPQTQPLEAPVPTWKKWWNLYIRL